MNIRNHTPHEITLVLPDGQTLVLPPVAPCPRVGEHKEPLAVWASVPVVRVRPGAVCGLPPQEPDTLLIVSRMVADAARDRSDLVSPGDLVRDDKGRIVGCRTLVAVG